MSVTAEAVKALRERTGAGMMECKKALVETNGDLDAAAELMRKQGLAKADKKAARVAAEGVIAVEQSADGKTAVLVEVNCETDFVAREDDFRASPTTSRRLALAAQAGRRRRRCWPPGCLAARRSTSAPRAGRQDRREHQRPPLRAASTAAAPLGAYLHGTRIGTLVALEGGDDAWRATWPCTWPRPTRSTCPPARCRPTSSPRSARS